MKLLYPIFLVPNIVFCKKMFIFFVISPSTIFHISIVLDTHTHTGAHSREKQRKTNKKRNRNEGN